MLHRIKTIAGHALRGLDGELGSIEEFYFDDRHWTIRYLVADTGGWLGGRKVLISPYALSSIDNKGKTVSISLTKKQIEDSPAIESDKPVSRQDEKIQHDYYGWPVYWVGDYMWGAYSTYPYLVRDRDKWAKPDPNKAGWDSNLRSTKHVTGYHIQATDGEIGHVEDFILDDETWAIRYLIIDTKNWWPGKKVLVSPQWIERVSWSEERVHVRLSRESIKRSPAYTEEMLVTRDFESQLHIHYQSKAYWTDDLGI
ncbi:MAG: PRC-barrel domain-containing protein [bacterium]|jgi:uncharacterized protein YrrD|nr:PRC-barrel domain-containing protein [bacterium]